VPKTLTILEARFVRVLLVSANREEINMPMWPLGLACVGAATIAAGHDVRLLDLMHEEEPDSALKAVIREFQPMVIGISVRNIDDQNMAQPIFYLDEVRKFVALCKGCSQAPVVLGGAGYSMLPEAALSYLGADMGVQGEGETVFPALVAGIERKADLSEIPGVYLSNVHLRTKRPYVTDLDQLPLPDPSLLLPPNLADPDFWLPVQTRRGCPLNCSYCSTATIEGTRYRSRSPERIVQWLRRWARAGARRVFFVDNTFNRPPSYAKKLCRELSAASLDIRWRCIFYPEKVSAALVEAMAKAGCREVSLGFESGSETVLGLMNKRFTPEDVENASQLLADHGITRTGFLLLGAPGETRATVRQSLAFADSLNLEALKITVGIRIYPNTMLAKRAVEDGIISADDDLLFPRYYVTPGLEAWLRGIVEDWVEERPNWMT
jgi:radical SAM superfamily enzyme YgiQ (UPF0313 family)